MKIILLVIILLIVPFAHAEWERADYTDPFTDTHRIGVKNDNILIWCEPKYGGWKKKYILAAILTDGVPYITSSEYTYGVLFKYRVDKSEHVKGTLFPATGFDGLMDYQGFVNSQGALFCTDREKHCSKPFVKQILDGNNLIYSAHTVPRSEFREVDLNGGRERLKAVVDECK